MNYQAMHADREDNDGIESELLDPSELGTKEYWDATYTRELENHEEDAEDEGTIWFSESNAEKVVLKQLNKLEENGILRRHPIPSASGENTLMASRFLDLGTGNGHMLFSLCDEDGLDDNEGSWGGEMVGVDYSLASVQLARRIAAQRSDNDSSSPRFEEWNILTDSPDPEWLKDGFDVVLDKGTFDAISLMPHEGSTHPCETYHSKITPLLKPGGFVFITSCNWTRDELIDLLAPTGSDKLDFYREAEYPTFTFGGKKGQSVVTVIFRRKGDKDGRS